MTQALPLHQPRYAIVLKFPVATLAPYVGLSAEALAWCNANRVRTVADVKRSMRPQGRSRLVKCPMEFREEFERLADPPGIPAAWPLHPEDYYRLEQQFAHDNSGYSVIRNVVLHAVDQWKALLYLVHFEEDFGQYKGVGPVVLPKVLAWRDLMRQYHAKPEKPLTADALKGRERIYTQPMQPAIPQPWHSPTWSPSSSFISFSFQLDLADPLLIEKLQAVKAIIG